MQHPSRSRNLLVAVAAAVLLAGCASLSRGGDLGEEFATVLVENDSPLMVNITAVRLGSRYRLGTVPGLGTREFSLRRHYLDNASYLQLVIEPLGGQRSYRTDRIVVDPGQRVRLQVSNFIR